METKKERADTFLLHFPLPPAEIAACGRRLKDCAEEVTALEEKWLDVSSALEELAR